MRYFCALADSGRRLGLYPKLNVAWLPLKKLSTGMSFLQLWMIIDKYSLLPLLGFQFSFFRNPKISSDILMLTHP